MRAILLKTQPANSRFGGTFYYAFFKGIDGKSYRSCLYPKYRNFVFWRSLIGKENVLLDNLAVKGTMVDADSQPKILATEGVGNGANQNN